MKEKIHYLYRHIRSDKNEPFYIGMGTVYKQDENSKTETVFYKRAYSIQHKNNIWKKIVNKTKYEVDIILESNNYEFIKSKELEFIKLYGRINLKTGILSNLTNGGDGTIGYTHSKEFKDNCKKRMSGSKLSEITRKRMSETRHKLQVNKIKVIDLSTNIIYDSIVESAKGYGINLRTLHNYLNGRTVNKTTLIIYNKL